MPKRGTASDRKAACRRRMPRSGKNCCGSNKDNTAAGGGKAHEVCCPGRDKTSRKESFKGGKAAKNLIGLHEVVIFVRCFEVCKTSELSYKGFNCCGAKMSLRCAVSRFAEPRCFLRGRTGCHFLHRAKSNQKARGAKPCDPRFKALPKVSLQKFPAARAETGFAHKTPA